MRRGLRAILLASICVPPTTLDAQRTLASSWEVCPGSSARTELDGAREFARPRGSAETWVAPCVAPQVQRTPNAVPALDTAGKLGRETAWAILASAIFPGAGQAMLRQRRFAPYLAVEGFAWASYANDARSASRNRDGYRALARAVARAAFSPIGPVGDFDYYERMEHFAESGALDVVPGGQLDPEADTSTFNGSMWLLARRTFWKNVDVAPDRESSEWRRAESFYLQRAIRPEYRWSWAGADGDYTRFRRLIRRSNDANRSALGHLGLVLANHMLSSVDALVSVRIRQRNGFGMSGYSVDLSIPF